MEKLTAEQEALVREAITLMVEETKTQRFTKKSAKRLEVIYKKLGMKDPYNEAE